MSLIDSSTKWYAATSRWSLLEVARALKKDGKTKEIIELDLRELRSHKIDFVPVSENILSMAEKLMASTSVFAADAVHVSTYRKTAQRSQLEGFLCEDLHYQRFKTQVPVKAIEDLKI